MPISYRIRRLDAEIRAAYGRFFPEQAQANGLGRLDWRFDRNPAAPGLIAVAEDEGGIVGLSSYVPATLSLPNGDTGLAYQAIDSFVAPEARGQGVFGRLAQRFVESGPEHGADGVYGIPNDQAAPAWFGKLAWRRFGMMPFLFKPLSSSYFLRRLGLEFGNLSLSVARDAGAPRLERFDGRADALWDRLQPALGVGVRRNADYLNWRLFDTPAARYRTVASNGAFSFVSSLTAAKHGGTIGYVMEALGPESFDLLMSEIGRMRAEGVEVVLAWCNPGSANYRLHRRAGFLPLPERLRPLELHFGAKGFTVRGQAMTNSPWYLSYLDSDTV